MVTTDGYPCPLYTADTVQFTMTRWSRENYAVPDAWPTTFTVERGAVCSGETNRGSSTGPALGSAKNHKCSRKIVFIVTGHGVAKIFIRAEGELNMKTQF